jgi:penicillin-binding protein 1A
VKTEAPAAIENVFTEIRRIDARRFGLDQLLDGRIQVQSTVDNRVQRIVNEALENGLKLYEQRHPGSQGQVQGSVVVLRNDDARVLAEAGGRRVYQDRYTSYSDYNRVTESRRQPGSALKPVVYLAAFRNGALLDSPAFDAPISVPMGGNRPAKWISNYDQKFKGVIPVRQALAESRNAATIWVTKQVGIHAVLDTARELGIRSRLQPYITTALGASEVSLLELANVYRAMASGLLADPYVVERVRDSSGNVLYQSRPQPTRLRGSAAHLAAIQEGLRGVVRLPGGTAHSLESETFPIQVMGKTGTTSDFRDALFIGSTYGKNGITVAVRIGYDDNRELGDKETGGRAALPIFKEIMLGVYKDDVLGAPPTFPESIEEHIDGYLEGRMQALLAQAASDPEAPAHASPAALVTGGSEEASLAQPAALPASVARTLRPDTSAAAARPQPAAASPDRVPALAPGERKRPRQDEASPKS